MGNRRNSEQERIRYPEAYQRQDFGREAERYRSSLDKRTSRRGAVLLNVTVFVVVFTLVLVLFGLFNALGVIAILVALVAAALAASSIHIALEWERAVVLRLGKFNRIVGAGVYFTIPIIEFVTITIDQRTIATPFGAEETLTNDLVPLDIDAVLFWVIYDPAKASKEVEDVRFAVLLAAQTTLRDAIGRASVNEVVSRRNQLDSELKKAIESKVNAWGVDILSVEIRDIFLPEELHEVMSIEAQAERQRNARMILMESEADISAMLKEASKAYQDAEEALRLRQMHLMYESVRETGGTVVVPSAYSEGFTEGTGADGVQGKGSVGNVGPERK